MPAQAQYKNIQVDEDCLIGIFKKDDKYAFMVVNFNDPIYKKSCHLEMTIVDKEVKKLHYCGKEIKMNSCEMNFTLDCGDGVFIEIE